MARGLQNREQGIDVPALEMKKWFDTYFLLFQVLKCLATITTWFLNWNLINSSS
jgi:hypothetical protein